VSILLKFPQHNISLIKAQIKLCVHVCVCL